MLFNPQFVTLTEAFNVFCSTVSILESLSNTFQGRRLLFVGFLIEASASESMFALLAIIVATAPYWLKYC